MYEGANARRILLLAAEDAFEFERWREAGPVTAEIDPEIKAAEIAEFEALGIPMPAELDSLRRELEHAPKVREAIRNSALAMRRGGRATASALVALGPQQLMPMGAMGPGPMGWPMGAWPMGMDPRLAARMAEQGRPPRSRARAQELDELDELDDAPTKVRARGRKVGSAPIDDGPIEAEVVDEFVDDSDDDDEFDDPPPKPRARARGRASERRGKARPEPRSRAARGRDEWDEDDDDGFDSIVATSRPPSDPRTTWLLGAVATAAVIGLLWVAFNGRGSQASSDDALAQQQQLQQLQQPVAAPQPVVEPPPAYEPAPPEPEPAPVEAAPASAGARSPSRSSGVRGSSSSSPSTNPFADYKVPDDPAALAKPAAGGATQPATQPAAGGAPQPAAGGATQPAEGQPTPPPTPTPAAEEPKPAEPPKAPPPEEPALTKSKMTPAIRDAVVKRVGDLQACYQDAVVGKPDLTGQVVFTISLDQDGVVKKVDVAKDEVKYGVASCSAKKIRRWTLPSAGIPIIFDLPFDFQP